LVTLALPVNGQNRLAGTEDQVSSLGRKANDVVGPVMFLPSDAAWFVTGINLPVDGGNLAFDAGGSKTW
jgi:NAD(P)-dependent dehydrogenase (short-subunit alcohol dehydrogenase family)